MGVEASAVGGDAGDQYSGNSSDGGDNSGRASSEGVSSLEDGEGVVLMIDVVHSQ